MIRKMRKQWLTKIAFLVWSVSFVCAQSAQEIVDNALEKLGGKANYDSLKAAHVMLAMGQGPVTFSAELKYDQDQGIFLQIEAMGKEQLIITNREKAWVKRPEDVEPQELDLQKLGSIDDEFGKKRLFAPLSDFAYLSSNLSAVSLLKKKKKVEKKKCFVLEVPVPRDTTSLYDKQIPDLKRRYFINSEDYLPIRTEEEQYDKDTNSTNASIVTTYTNYKKVDRILLPHKTIQTIEGTNQATGRGDPSQTTKITAIRLNPEFSADLFTVEEDEYSEDF